jgi:hypothetical protein
LHGKIHRTRREQNDRTDGREYKTEWNLVNRKMMHIFLSGMLCGVMTATAFTYAFAIPANNYHWQMEIWNRGGAAWTSDKNGHSGWKWMVEPISDTPRQKPVTAPAYKANVRTEQL